MGKNHKRPKSGLATFKFWFFVYSFMILSLGRFVLSLITHFIHGNPASAIGDLFHEIIYLSLWFGLFVAIILWLVTFVLTKIKTRN